MKLLDWARKPVLKGGPKTKGRFSVKDYRLPFLQYTHLKDVVPVIGLVIVSIYCGYHMYKSTDFSEADISAEVIARGGVPAILPSTIRKRRRQLEQQQQEEGK